MNIREREIFYKAIKELDPNGEIVKLDLNRNYVAYSSKIVQHRKIRELTDEELVRAYIVSKLIEELEYSSDSIELEKPLEIARTEIRIDVLVNKKKKSFMMFEIKEPEKYEEEMEKAIKNQLFNVASVEDPEGIHLKYLIYYTVYPSEAKPIEKIVTIDYSKYKTYASWEIDEKPNLMSIPKKYGVVRRAVFVKGSHNDLRIDVPKSELNKISQKIHNVLWGGGRYAGNVVFNNLLKLFLTKIYDEKETEAGKPYDFQIYYEDGKPESAENVLKKIEPLYRKALKEYLGYKKEKLERAFIEIDANRVKYMVETFQDISFVENRYGLLGDFFETVIRSEFKQTKGQYFTHSNIIGFINRALCVDELALKLVNEEKRLLYIIDPACGSGKFLTDQMDLITSTVIKNEDKLKKTLAVREFVNMWFPEERRNFWATRYVYGVDNNVDLATATKVNMIGHGDGSGNIEAKDALLDFEEYSTPLLQIKKTSEVYPRPVNEQFDVVISNPPFRITIDRYTADKLPQNFVWGEKTKSRLEKAKEKEKEVDIETLFIERWYQLLRPKGRLGVVLPESIFNTVGNLYVRLFLYKYFEIKAVVSLPYLTFQPYTATKTSLLFAQKKTPDEVREYQILWDKIESEFDEIHHQFDSLRKLATVVRKKSEYVDGVADLLGGEFNPEDAQLNFVNLRTKYDDKVRETLRAYSSVARTIDKLIEKEKLRSDELSDLKKCLGELFGNISLEGKDIDLESLKRLYRPKFEYWLREFKSLKKKLSPLLKIRIATIEDRDKLVILIERLLKIELDAKHKEMDFYRLMDKFSDEIDGMEKERWIFNEICKKIDYPILMAHVEEIGYKRSLYRGELERPNYLFKTLNSTIVVTPEKPQTVLDYIRRDVKWK